jgi:hypothetical protein
MAQKAVMDKVWDVRHRLPTLSADIYFRFRAQEDAISSGFAFSGAWRSGGAAADIGRCVARQFIPHGRP